MDKDRMTYALKGSISEVLEKMFFLPLDFTDPPESGGLGARGEDLVEVGLDFSGPLSGRFVFSIPAPLARSLAADFMGSEASSVTAAHGEETAKEILNMIAGSAFSMYDLNAVFDLGIPETMPEGEAGPQGDRDEISLVVETLEGRLGLRFMADRR